jgi:ligand-binding sensor domain-containing protein
MLPKPSKWLWLATSAFVFFIAAIYLSAAIKLAVGRVGWSHITHENSFLPSNAIYALLPLEEDQMLIGTERGAAIWTPPQSTDDAPTWTIYTTENTGLPSNRILSLTKDVDGNIWYGTSEGITRFDGTSWKTFDQNDLGLSSDYILCLGSGPDGLIYSGTMAGASVWNGSNWSPVAGMDTQTVFSLAFAPEGREIYFGVESGVVKVNVHDDTLTSLPTDAPVKHLLVDSNGKLWAATSGAGLATLEGQDWAYFRVNNSGIPYSVVNWTNEVQPGVFWIGTARPASSGGAPASFDGTQWYSYLTNNSGASGAEVTSIVVQSEQVWIGTRTSGIDMFKIGR